MGCTACALRSVSRDGAYVEFFSRVHNPIAVKRGPTTDVDAILGLLDRLDPEREPGRLTFVLRAGADRIRDLLPDLVSKTAESSGHKTREFATVLDEVRGFAEVHQTLGTHPGGVHVELTGDDVTECVGGGDEILAEDLPRRYETACDPRLNHSQSLELAFLVAQMLRRSAP